MRVALVHGFLKEYGGAERVLEAFHEIWPKAPIFTAFVDFKGLGPHGERIRKWEIRESALGKTWLIKKLHSPLRFLAPLIWESFNLDNFDVVITSSGWYINRGIITKPETLHICYLHHPPRHLYNYKTAVEWQKYWPVKIYGYLVNHCLRLYDFLAAQRVDFFIANSKETQRRIAKFYRKESVVVYPPVQIPKVSRIKHLRGVSGSGISSTSKVEGSPRKAWGDTLEVEKKDYFLCVSRLARAKNIHLAIEACNRLGLPLKIVGKGREEKYLRSIAGPTVEFLGEASDQKLARIYARAKALIFPAEDEEFGIVPVEAMSFGVPVIALQSGGVKETVINPKKAKKLPRQGPTGVFFEKPTGESLIRAIKQLSNLEINKDDCLNQAKKFSKKRFKKEIIKFVKEKYESWAQNR